MYEVGDKVRIIATRTHYCELHSIATIAKVNLRDEIIYVDCYDISQQPRHQGIGFDEIELVEKNNPPTLAQIKREGMK